MTRQQVKLAIIQSRQRKRHKKDWTDEVHRQLEEFFDKERAKRYG
jgi:hypothetical protein